MSSNTYDPFSGFSGNNNNNKGSNWKVVDTKSLMKKTSSSSSSATTNHHNNHNHNNSNNVTMDFSQTGAGANKLLSLADSEEWRKKHNISVLDPFNKESSEKIKHSIPPPLTEFSMLETFIQFINSNKKNEDKETDKNASSASDLKYNHFPQFIFQKLKQLNFTAPTPIQAQSWSFLLLLKDFVGIAKTGSGKTFSFMIPSIIFVWNILKDTNNNHNHNNYNNNRQAALEGPYVLVLAPTRELAQQIEAETVKILPSSTDNNNHNNNNNQIILSACIFGGAPKGPQLNMLRQGVHILIATPGRLIDFINIDKVHLTNTLFFILDEADRMLDMGFEPQVKEIHAHIMGTAPRPEHHHQQQRFNNNNNENENNNNANTPKKNLLSLMFSATWPVEIQALAKFFLKPNFLRVNIGSTELLANKDVKQTFVYIPREGDKLEQLKKILLDKKQENTKLNVLDGRVLVFVKTKKNADFLEFQLKKLGLDVMAIHGDKEQRHRDYMIQCFKRGSEDTDTNTANTNNTNNKGSTGVKNHMILVATDVAARGLDIKKLKLVINYDFPGQIDDYVHRIGRTGRAGEKGESITFITKKEDAFNSNNFNNIAKLIGIVERAQGKEAIPDWMMEWAQQHNLIDNNNDLSSLGNNNNSNNTATSTTKFNYVCSGTKRNRNMGANFDGKNGPKLNYFGLGGSTDADGNETASKVKRFSSSDDD